MFVRSDKDVRIADAELMAVRVRVSERPRLLPKENKSVVPHEQHEPFRLHRNLFGFSCHEV